MQNIKIGNEMKHFLFALTAILCSCVLSGCDTTKDDDNPVICPSFNPFNGTYTVDGNGFCTDEGAGVIPEEDVKKEIVGYGWKNIGTYEVQTDGHLSTTDYWKGMIGGGTTDLWFTSESKAVKFYNDSDIRKKYQAAQYAYDAGRGFVLFTFDKTTSGEADRYMQIVSFGSSGDRRYLYTVQKIGNQSTGDGNMKPVFAMVVYQRMIDKELEDKKAAAKYVTTLMCNHYSQGTNVGKQVDAYRKLFKALPEKADIKTFWQTGDTRIALVLNDDGCDPQNRYYYVHAEPK